MPSSKPPVVSQSTPAPSPEHAPEKGRRFPKSARIRIIENQLKVAQADVDEDVGKTFEFYCDEPPSLGGENQFPQPLTYIAAGVGF